jgi:hypothetical protein
VPTSTPKGIPKPLPADPPNGPTQIGAVADWLDNMLTATAGQLLRSNPATASDVEWAWPGARVVATVGSIVGPAYGDLAVQTSGTVGLYVYLGAVIGWRAVTPDLAGFARGYRASAVGGSLPDATDVTLATLGPITLEAGRRYEFKGRVRVQATTAGEWVQVGAQINRTDGLEIAKFPGVRVQYLGATNDPNIDTTVTWGSITGGGAAQTFNVRVFRTGGAGQFMVQDATLELYDQGVG